MDQDFSSLVPLRSTSCGSPSVREPSQPEYVKAALRNLTRAERKVVLAGYYNGDARMATVRALQHKALFYLRINSPNGRCGELVLTPLGETVRGILKARADKATGGAA